ncbi:hypothetical protein GCM10011579_071130 [Streptomyces albiflavescens]|uniref:Uncharacterized protein n=1 Tax=Streptomyces albiflavescens TaxID=1623582 RepID=A0A917YA28_9ACTN|nr:hypothetical protein GCM10011579_071130 [Streptomyces albiflavescens]
MLCRHITGCSGSNPRYRRDVRSARGTGAWPGEHGGGGSPWRDRRDGHEAPRAAAADETSAAQLDAVRTLREHLRLLTETDATTGLDGELAAVVQVIAQLAG